MRHDEYKERILLSILGELDVSEERVLREHVAECADCRAELEETTSFVAMVGEAAAAHPSDDLLDDARARLRVALAKAGSRPLGEASRVGWLSLLFSERRAVFAGVAALIVGFIVGYIAFGRHVDFVARGPVPQEPRETIQTPSEPGEITYRNVRLANVDPRTNEVELEYDVVRPARLKAAMDDERVRNILIQAVMNDENAGTRLQAINAIGTYADTPPSVEIERALVRAVKSDPNAGVRKQALHVLYRMPFDEEIKRTCLHVLTNDENEGMRVAAINMLALAMLEGQLEGREIVDAVGPRLQKDPNDYIRIQSKAFIQEVSSNVQ